MYPWRIDNNSPRSITERGLFYTPEVYSMKKAFSFLNEKSGDTCDEKSQISPLKRQGKGSLLLPCSKMPIVIFLFSLKSDFQKSEENGEKRRKPTLKVGGVKKLSAVRVCLRQICTLAAYKRAWRALRGICESAFLVLCTAEPSLNPKPTPPKEKIEDTIQVSSIFWDVLTKKMPTKYSEISRIWSYILALWPRNPIPFRL